MKNRIIKICFAIVMIIAIACSATGCADVKSPAEAKGSVVCVVSSAGDSLGSGFAIGKPGKDVQFIVTAYHIIAEDKNYDAQPMIVFSAAANDFMYGEIYKYNEAMDIAVIRLPQPTNKRVPLAISTKDKVKLDGLFTALGYPGSVAATSDFSKYDVTDIVSTQGGIAKSDRVGGVEKFVFTGVVDAGNSGGPLVDEKGSVVGICSTKIIDTEYSYFIACDELLKIIDDGTVDFFLAGEIQPLTIILICIGVVAVALIVLVIVLVTKKKNNVPLPAENLEPIPMPGPNMYAQVQNNQVVLNQPAAPCSIGCISGALAGRSFQVAGRTVFGRDSSKCQIVYPLNAPGISGVHCEIKNDNGVILLTDLGSSYGTFIQGGSKLSPNVPVRVSAGARFYLGSEDNMFEVRM